MITKNSLSFKLLAAVSLLFTLGGIVIIRTPVSAAPAVFTVTNTNDSGAGSLRQAVTSANTNGNPADQDVIEFNISDPDDVSINPQSSLTISQSVLINGYTQGDAEPNDADWPEPLNGTLRVEIDNSDAGPIIVSGNDVTLQGLVINGGDGNINVSGDDFVLQGSYVDTETTGLFNKKYTSGASQSIVVSDAANARFGGALPSERNILGACQLTCIDASGSDTTGFMLFGNNIGVAADGVTALETSSIFFSSGLPAIYVHDGASDVQIGGDQAGEGNSIEHNWKGALNIEDVSDLRILGNRIMYNFAVYDNSNRETESGIRLAGVTGAEIGSAGNGRNIVAGNVNGSLQVIDSSVTNEPSTNIRIINNYFGIKSDGVTNFSNSHRANLVVKGSSDSVLIQDNVIRNAEGDDAGVDIQDDAQRVAVIDNSIYQNGGLGIKLYNDDFEINDTDDVDSGPNGLLNIPDDLSREEVDGDTVMRFSYNGPVSETYRIDFYSNVAADGSGYGEGQTHIGNFNITRTTSGVEQYEHTLNGDGYQNITATATMVDGDASSGYGPTSGFSEIAGDPAVPDPIIDLGIVGELNNPQSLTPGDPASYTVTIKNYGPDSIDISGFDNSNFGQNFLAQFTLPPDLTFASTNGNVSCASFGPNTSGLAGPLYANHTNYELVLCGYSGPSNMLDAGESISFTLNVLVDEASDLEFNAVFSGPNTAYDPEFPSLVGIYNSGSDLIDYLENTNNYHPNNVMLSYYPLIDINTQKELVDPPETVSVGDELTYRFTFTNDGIANIDLADFDGSGDIPYFNIFLSDLLPPELEYTSVSDSNVTCGSMGPGSASIFDVIYTNHSDYSFMGCNYTVPTTIAPGESVSFDITTTVVSDFEGQITNYAIGPGGILLQDPDSAFVRRAFFQAFNDLGDDALDLLQSTQNNDNFSLSAYTNGSGETPGGGDNGGSEGGGSNGGAGVKDNSDNDGLLADTGQRFMLTGFAVLCLVLSSLAINRLRKKQYPR